MWIGHAPTGSLRFRYADPSESALADFDCGESAYAGEVNDYFRSAAWIGQAQTTTVLQFGCDDDAAVAFVALRLVGDQEVILVLGIAVHWQGRGDPADPAVRILDSVVSSVSQIARENGASTMALRVRAGNERAFRAYTRLGFVQRGPILKSTRGPTLEMVLAIGDGV